MEHKSDPRGGAADQ